MTEDAGRMEPDCGASAHEPGHQHAHILVLARALYRSVGATGAGSERLRRVDEVIGLFAEHCLEEERMLRRVSHPATVAQCREHQAILDVLSQQRRALMLQPRAARFDLLRALDALVIHIVLEESGSLRPRRGATSGLVAGAPAPPHARAPWHHDTTIEQPVL